MKKITFLLATLLLNLPLFSNQVYDSIELLPFDATGSFVTESSLDRIFREKEIKTVIELGSWAGASTRFLGYRVGEGGKVYAVDHWMGTKNQHGEMSDSRLPHIYQLFLSNVKHMELTDRIVPVRMASEEAAKALNVKADLIYLDAERDSESVYRNILNWYPHLNENGVLCGAEYREPGVKNGVHRAAERLGKEIETDRKGYFWAFK